MRTDPDTTSGNFTGTSERRAHPRLRPQPFAYVKVGEHNGGIVMDASETGLQIAAANSLAPENIVRLSLQLDPSAEPVEAEARVVWLSESKKTGGFEFVSLTDEARDQIRKWLHGDGVRAQSPGPRAVPNPVRDQRAGRARRDTGTNGAKSEIRKPVVSVPPPKGLETMFPPEGQPLPPSAVREVEEPRNGVLTGERVPGAARLRDPAPFRRESAGGDQDQPNAGYFREPVAAPDNESRFPARAIFSTSPFQAPPIEPQRSSHVGLWIVLVMVVCFAVGIIAGKLWTGEWPRGWTLHEPAGRVSESAPPPPAITPPEAAPKENPTTSSTVNPNATPDANGPDTNGTSTASPSSSPPAVTAPVPPENPVASSNGRSDARSDAKPDAEASRGRSPNKSSAAPNFDSEPSFAEPAGSILVTAPAAGSPPTRVSLPQEPLTASASVAIGIRRSALLPPQPGPVSAHSPERLEFGKIMAQVPDILSPNIPQWGDPIVVLRATIGEQGEIKSLVPIRGRDELIPKAERLVREWQQFPARLNGRPIESTEEIILTFRTGP